MLMSIEPVSIWQTNGTQRTFTSLEAAARFLTKDRSGERERPTYVAALKACLAALEGGKTAEEARDATMEAASAAGILAD